MKTLLMTVGLPRSGKTSWAKAQGHPIVNPDSIRLALHGQRFLKEAEPMVWVMAKYMVASLFLAGHNTVILDATNTTMARRDEWIDKRWVREMIPMYAGKDACIERARALGDDDIIPIIEKMDAQFEPYKWEAELRGWELEGI
jgi:predicted kinase